MALRSISTALCVTLVACPTAQAAEEPPLVKTWLKEQARELKADFREFKEDVAEWFEEAHDSIDANKNGTTRLQISSNKNAMADCEDGGTEWLVELSACSHLLHNAESL